MKNKTGIHIVLSCLLSPFVLNAGSVVDFDGGSKEPESVATQLKNAANNSVASSAKEAIAPPAPEQHPKLMTEFGILSDSGEWTTAQSTWTKEGRYVEAVPGSYLLFDQFCQNNTQYYWSLSFSYKMETVKKQTISPGHSHTNGIPPPPLTYDGVVVVPNPLTVSNIPPAAHHKFTMKMPAFATQIAVNVRTTASCDNTESTDIVVVREKIMSPMPKGGNSVGYILPFVPEGAAHPSIYNATNDFKAVLAKFGATWRETCPGSVSLSYLRMSLPLGGVFDMNSDWKEPYFGHDKGAAVDLSKRDIRKGNRQGLINLLCKDFKVYSEQDNDPSHYHVVSRKEAGDINWPGAVACCLKEAGVCPSPKACIDLTQGSELYPEKSDCPYLPDDLDCPYNTFR